MKMKNMKRTAWRRLAEREYAVRDAAPFGFAGRASLLRIRRVTAPLWVAEGDGQICIAADGYCWVQVACENQPYWLTAMFDEKGRFLQIYLDICLPPRFDDPDDPVFTDLFLDVVVSSDRRLTVLDRDELEAALASGELDQATYQYALAALERLLSWLPAHKEALIDYVSGLYRELLGTL